LPLTLLARSCLGVTYTCASRTHGKYRTKSWKINFRFGGKKAKKVSSCKRMRKKYVFVYKACVSVRDSGDIVSIGQDESGWCSDMTSTHGAWRHAGVRFLLLGVLLLGCIFCRYNVSRCILHFARKPVSRPTCSETKSLD